MACLKFFIFFVFVSGLYACGGGGQQSTPSSSISVSEISSSVISSSVSSIPSSSATLVSSSVGISVSSMSSGVSSSISSVSMAFTKKGSLELFIGDALDNPVSGNFEVGDIVYRTTNPQVISVDENTGRIKAESSGEAKVVAELKSADGLSALYSVTVANPSANITILVGNDVNSVQLSEHGKGIHVSRVCDSLLCTKNYLGVFGGDPITDVSDSSLTDYLFEFAGESVQVDVIGEGFPRLFHHQTLTFKDQIWVFGGQNGASISNSILTSNNGISWNNRDSSDGFPGRQEHQVVLFKERLWLIGGYGYADRDIYSTDVLNDVWSSEDGIRWEKVLGSAPFEGRRKHKVVSFAGKLWLIGGENIKGTGLTDLWSSNDGMNWVLEKADVVGERLYNHELTVFDNKIWMVKFNSIWSSINGVDWVKNYGFLPFSANGRLFVHDQQLWSSSVGSGLTFWRSADGVNWSQVTESPLLNKSDHEVISFGAKIFILGGYEENDVTRVLVSEEGAAWSNALQKKFSPRYSHSIAEFNGKLWMIGGLLQSGSANDVWVSNDGLVWDEALSVAPFSKRSDHNLISWNGKLFLIGGLGKNDIWSSSDGINWVLENEIAAFPSSVSYQLISYSDRLWLFGDDNSVWTSVDAISWTKSGVISEFSIRSAYSLAVYKERLWLVGGLQMSDRTMKNDVWSSTNGVTWTLEAGAASFPPVAWHKLTVFNNKLVLSAGSKDVGQSGDIWISDDGVEWSFVSNIYPARSSHTMTSYNGKLIIVGGIKHFSGPIGEVTVTSDLVDWKDVYSQKIDFQN